MKPILSILITLSIGLALLSACAPAAAPAAAPASGGAATGQSLKVSGGEAAKSFTRADLEALTATQAAFKGASYKGVAVAELLKAAGFDPAQVKAVKAVAVDGFTVNYDPSQFTDTGVIVAYANADGSDLSSDDGAFRMVLPNAEGKLNVRQLVELQVTK